MSGQVRRGSRQGERSRSESRQGGTTMRSRGRMIAAVVLGLLFAGAAAADTLELRDGRVLHGRYLGGTQAVLRFEIRGEVQTFNVSEAVALTFTGSASSMGAPAPAPPPRSSE